MTYVAAIQMVSTDTLSKNLELTEKLIEEAAAKKAKLITLPENFPLMGKQDKDRLAITEPFNDGPLQLFLSEQSKRYKIWLLGGTVPLVSDNPEKVFATSLLFNPNGECIARYDKIHLFDVVLDKDDGESYRENMYWFYQLRLDGVNCNEKKYKQFTVGGSTDGVDPVSYTHLTLPTQA